MSWDAASGCCPDCGGCGCRCRGRGCRTATRGRSPPVQGSCWSTPACTRRARWPSSSGRWTRSTSASSTCGCWSSPTRHSDHWGQAAPICERAGCELWMHPNHEHAARTAAQIVSARSRAGSRWPARAAFPRRRSQRYAERAKEIPSGIARVIEPDRELVPGVEIETDLGSLDGARDARPRALARLPLPARAPAADLRRPSARARSRCSTTTAGRPIPWASSCARWTCVGRLDARLACRVTASRSSTSPATSRPTASWSHERLAAARRRAWRAGPDGDRDRPARSMGSRSTAQRPLVADPDPVLPAPPRASGRGPARAGWRETEVWLQARADAAGRHRPRATLTYSVKVVIRFRHAHRRDPRRRPTSRSSPSSSSRPRPTTASASSGSRSKSLRPARARLRVGHLRRRRRLAHRTLELTKWIKQELGIEAMAHLSCVGSTREELERDPRRHARCRNRERARAARRSARVARPSGDRIPGGLRYSTELAALITDGYDLCVGGGLLSRGPSRGAGPGPRPALPQARRSSRRRPS